MIGFKKKEIRWQKIIKTYRDRMSGVFRLSCRFLFIFLSQCRCNKAALLLLGSHCLSWLFVHFYIMQPLKKKKTCKLYINWRRCLLTLCETDKIQERSVQPAVTSPRVDLGCSRLSREVKPPHVALLEDPKMCSSQQRDIGSDLSKVCVYKIVQT